MTVDSNQTQEEKMNAHRPPADAGVAVPGLADLVLDELTKPAAPQSPYEIAQEQMRQRASAMEKKEQEQELDDPRLIPRSMRRYIDT